MGQKLRTTDGVGEEQKTITQENAIGLEQVESVVEVEEQKAEEEKLQQATIIEEKADDLAQEIKTPDVVDVEQKATISEEAMALEPEQSAQIEQLTAEEEKLEKATIIEEKAVDRAPEDKAKDVEGAEQKAITQEGAIGLEQVESVSQVEEQIVEEEKLQQTTIIEKKADDLAQEVKSPDAVEVEQKTTIAEEAKAVEPVERDEAEQLKAEEDKFQQSTMIEEKTDELAPELKTPDVVDEAQQTIKQEDVIGLEQVESVSPVEEQKTEKEKLQEAKIIAEGTDDIAQDLKTSDVIAQELELTGKEEEELKEIQPLSAEKSEIFDGAPHHLEGVVDNKSGEAVEIESGSKTELSEKDDDVQTKEMEDNLDENVELSQVSQLATVESQQEKPPIEGSEEAISENVSQDVSEQYVTSEEEAHIETAEILAEEESEQNLRTSEHPSEEAPVPATELVEKPAADDNQTTTDREKPKPKKGKQILGIVAELSKKLNIEAVILNNKSKESSKEDMAMTQEIQQTSAEFSSLIEDVLASEESMTMSDAEAQCIESLILPLEKLCVVVTQVNEEMAQSQIQQIELPEMQMAVSSLKAAVDKAIDIPTEAPLINRLRTSLQGFSQNLTSIGQRFTLRSPIVPPPRDQLSNKNSLKEVSGSLSQIEANFIAHETTEPQSLPLKTEEVGGSDVQAAGDRRDKKAAKALVQSVQALIEELKASSEELLVHGVVPVSNLLHSTELLNEAIIKIAQIPESAEDISDAQAENILNIKEPLEILSVLISQSKQAGLKPELATIQTEGAKQAIQIINQRVESIFQGPSEAPGIKLLDQALQSMTSSFNVVPKTETAERSRQDKAVAKLLLDSVQTVIQQMTEAQKIVVLTPPQHARLLQIVQPIELIQSTLEKVIESPDTFEDISEEQAAELARIQAPLEEIQAVLVESIQASVSAEVHGKQKAVAQNAIASLKEALKTVESVSEKAEGIKLLEIPLKSLSASLVHIEDTTEVSVSSPAQLLRETVQKVSLEVQTLKPESSDVSAAPQQASLQVLEKPIKAVEAALDQLAEVSESSPEEALILSQITEPFEKLRVVLVQSKQVAFKPAVSENVAAKVKHAVLSLKETLEAVLQVPSEAASVKILELPLKTLSASLGQMETLMADEPKDTTERNDIVTAKLLIETVQSISQEIQILKHHTKDISISPQQASLENFAEPVKEFETILEEIINIPESAKDLSNEEAERLGEIKQPLEKLRAVLVEAKHAALKPEVLEQHESELKQAVAALKESIEGILQVPSETQSAKLLETPLTVLSATLNIVECSSAVESEEKNVLELKSLLQLVKKVSSEIQTSTQEFTDVSVSPQQGYIQQISEPVKSVEVALEELITTEAIQNISHEDVQKLVQIKTPLEKLSAVICQSAEAALKPEVLQTTTAEVQQAVSLLKGTLENVLQVPSEADYVKILEIPLKTLSASLGQIETFIVESVQGESARNDIKVAKLLKETVESISQEF
uniref:Uncharacterized protein n=1 Tax=Dendroctonus ponderosae TaxID=77166 RepID=A0AAR5P9V2_DENPD